jgi:hypothetical protein
VLATRADFVGVCRCALWGLANPHPGGRLPAKPVVRRAPAALHKTFTCASRNGCPYRVLLCHSCRQTHQNALGTLTPAFLQGPSSAGPGQAGNTDIVSNINALSAEAAHSELPRWVVRLAQTARRYRTTTPAPGRFCIRTRSRTRTSSAAVSPPLTLEPTIGRAPAANAWSLVSIDVRVPSG